MKKEDILARCIDDIKSGEKTLEECMRLYPELDGRNWQLLRIALYIPQEKVVSREELLADCIRDMESGKSPLQQTGQVDSQLDEEIIQLLAVASSINSIIEDPAPGFKEKAYENLVRAMGSTEKRIRAENPSFEIFRLQHLGRTIQVALTSAALVLVVVSVGVTAAFAAQSSLPGEPLYPVKKGMETFQFAMAPDKVGVQIKLAQKRVEEIGLQVDHGTGIAPSGITSYERHVAYVIDGLRYVPDDVAKSLLSQLFKTGLSYEMILERAGSKLQVSHDPFLGKALEFSRRELLLAGAAYDNPAILRSQLSITGWELEDCYFTVEGVLRTSGDRSWDIGGLKLAHVNSVTMPDAGMSVSISGLSFGDEVYVCRWEYREGIREGFRIDGVLNAAGKEAINITVGGILMAKPQNMELPDGPKMAVIEAYTRDNVLMAAHSEFRDMPASAFINGLLVAADDSQKTMTVEAAGVRFVVDITEAAITDRNGLTMSTADLALAAGKEITLREFFTENGKLGARQVSTGIDFNAEKD